MVTAKTKKRDVVYFSCNKDFQQTEAYAAVLAQLKRRHPDAIILEPAVIWQGKDWRVMYHKILAPVTHYYLIVPPSGLVGAGCWTEWNYMMAQGKPAIAFTAHGIGRVGALVIVNQGKDWTQYARVVMMPEGEGEAP